MTSWQWLNEYIGVFPQETSAKHKAKKERVSDALQLFFTPISEREICQGHTPVAGTM